MHGADIGRIKLSGSIVETVLKKTDAGIALDVGGSLLREGRHYHLRWGAITILHVLREGFSKKICLSGAGSGIDVFYVLHFNPPFKVQFLFP